VVVLRRLLDLKDNLDKGVEAVLLLVLPVLARVEGELEDAVLLNLRSGQEQTVVASVGVRLAVCTYEPGSADAHRKTVMSRMRRAHTRLLRG
jgi:hypothetical protein